jgi:hypothetical protein
MILTNSTIFSGNAGRTYHMWSKKRSSIDSNSPCIHAGKLGGFYETQCVAFEVAPVRHQLLYRVKEVLPESQTITFCIPSQQTKIIMLFQCCPVSELHYLTELTSISTPQKRKAISCKIVNLQPLQRSLDSHHVQASPIDACLIKHAT